MQELVSNNRLQEIESELEDLATISARLFQRAGQLLAEVRDSKLYKDAGYSTFEAYIEQRWHMSRRRAYLLISAAITVAGLAEYFPPEQLPKNESVARPLAALAPDEQAEIWSEVPADAQRKDVDALVKDYKIVGVYPLIGSKWKLSKVIAQQARGIEFDKYLEPFLGSGATFFRFVDEGLITTPGTAVLNDAHPFAIALFRVLRDKPEELQRQLELVPYARAERSQPEPAPEADDLEKALWWAVHTYQGYIGSDTKNKGWSIDHTNHAGRHEKWNRFKQQIPAMGQVLCQYAALECTDALNFIKKYTAKSDHNLLYVDPPYIGHENDYRASFNQHAELSALLTEVPAAGIFCTYYDCDELRQLYPESRWNWELFERQSTCTADGVRQPRTEVLLTRKEYLSLAVTPPQPAIEPAPQDDLGIEDTISVAEEPPLVDEIEAEDNSTKSIHFKSESSEHYTPQKIIDLVLEFFGTDQIGLDPCSNSKDSPNFPAQRVFTKEDDGLAQAWNAKTLFLNPPYGAEIDTWVSKLIHEYLSGNTKEAIALVPGRIDTQWFDRFYGYPACFVKGRLKFVGNETSAPFPSVLFYLGKRQDDFAAHFSTIGRIWIAGI